MLMCIRSFIHNGDEFTADRDRVEDDHPILKTHRDHFATDRQRLDRIRTAAANPGSLEKVEFHQARRTDDDFPGSKTNINRAVMEAQGRGLWAME